MAVFRKWLPLHKAVFSTFMKDLPSPVTAQKYRCSAIYTGPDDHVAQAIQNFDPNGPLMIYIFHSPIYTEHKYIMGRVFSGTCRKGDQVSVLSLNSAPITCSVDQLSLGIGIMHYPVDSVGPGQTVSIHTRTPLGSSHKFSTACSSWDVPWESCLANIPSDLHPIIISYMPQYPLKGLRSSSFAVIKAKISSNDPQFLVELKDYEKRYQYWEDYISCLEYYPPNTAVMSGHGEILLERLLGDLQEYNYVKRPFTTSEPVWIFRETVSTIGTVYIQTGGDYYSITAEPNRIKKANLKELCSGPEDTQFLADPSVELDSHSLEVLTALFKKTIKEGGLCKQPVRHVRWVIAHILKNKIGSATTVLNQTSPRIFSSAMLLAGPLLLEPIALVELAIPPDCLEAYKSVIVSEGQQLHSIDQQSGFIRCKYLVQMPKQVGLSCQLRQATLGLAFEIEEGFDHWRAMNPDVQSEMIQRLKEFNSTLP